MNKTERICEYGDVLRIIYSAFQALVTHICQSREEIQGYIQLEEREIRDSEKKGLKRDKKMAMTVKRDETSQRIVEGMSSRGNPFHAAPSCRDAIFVPVWLYHGLYKAGEKKFTATRS